MADHSPPSGSNNSNDLNDPIPRITDYENHPSDADIDALNEWAENNRSYITTIRWHRLPSMPVLSPLWGVSDSDYRHDLLADLLVFTQYTGRRLHDQEREAYLQYKARTCIAASYDRPFMAGLGLWLMGRSWRKSGIAAKIQQTQQQAQAHAMTRGGGVVAPDGTISHFSGPAAAGPSRNDMVRTLFRRAGRASLVGLSCWAGYFAVHACWMDYLLHEEAINIARDVRLDKVRRDIETNIGF